MLSVTITAFAGIKKCYKKPTINRVHLAVIQEQKNGNTSNDTHPVNREFCSNNIQAVLKEEDEKELNFQFINNNKAANPYFRLQHYTNPPFAPPDEKVNMDN